MAYGNMINENRIIIVYNFWAALYMHTFYFTSFEGFLTYSGNIVSCFTNLNIPNDKKSTVYSRKKKDLPLRCQNST